MAVHLKQTLVWLVCIVVTGYAAQTCHGKSHENVNSRVKGMLYERKAVEALGKGLNITALLGEARQMSKPTKNNLHGNAIVACQLSEEVLLCIERTCWNYQTGYRCEGCGTFNANKLCVSAVDELVVDTAKQLYSLTEESSTCYSSVKVLHEGCNECATACYASATGAKAVYDIAVKALTQCASGCAAFFNEVKYVMEYAYAESPKISTNYGCGC